MCTFLLWNFAFSYFHSSPLHAATVILMMMMMMMTNDNTRQPPSKHMVEKICTYLLVDGYTLGYTADRHEVVAKMKIRVAADDPFYITSSYYIAFLFPTAGRRYDLSCFHNDSGRYLASTPSDRLQSWYSLVSDWRRTKYTLPTVVGLTDT